jgi:hypothetical protein
MVCPIVESLVAEVPIVKLYSPEEEAVEAAEDECGRHSQSKYFFHINYSL